MKRQLPFLPLLLFLPFSNPRQAYTEEPALPLCSGREERVKFWQQGDWPLAIPGYDPITEGTSRPVNEDPSRTRVEDAKVVERGFWK